METMKKLNADIKEAQAGGVDPAALQAQMDNYKRLMAGASQSGKVFTKVMTSVDPEKLQSIMLAVLSGTMTCLVTMKNEVLSLITQSVDVAQQIAGQIKEQAKPSIIKYLKENKKSMDMYMDEEDKKKIQNEKGEFNANSMKWINSSIDILFMVIVISVCFKLQWILYVFASVQLGSTILADEINRLIV